MDKMIYLQDIVDCNMSICGNCNSNKGYTKNILIVAKN